MAAKYCLPYLKEAKYQKIMGEVNEITITYKPSDATLSDFLLLRAEQRVNIFIKDQEDFIENNRIKFFAALNKEHPELKNWYFRFRYKDETSKKLYELIKEGGYRFFFSNIVTDFDTLAGIARLKPYEIYLGESICFDLANCRKLVAEFENSNFAGFRTYVNVAQSAWADNPGLTKFWIRPEAAEKYSEYFSTFEFWFNSQEPEKAVTFYKIYKKGVWAGNLKEIISGLDMDLDSRTIMPAFDDFRMICGKRCLRGQKCKVCAAYVEVARVFSEQGLTVRELMTKH